MDLPPSTLQASKQALHDLAHSQAQSLTTTKGCGIGVDIELITDINIENETFIERNFTTAEQIYCWAKPNPHASFAGKWCAKEAAIKAVSSFQPPDQPKVWIKGDAAPLIEIEITVTGSGAPQVTFHGDAKLAVGKAGVSLVKVSISHIDHFAIATAIAQ